MTRRAFHRFYEDLLLMAREGLPPAMIEDLALFRRLRTLAGDTERRLSQHEVGTLLTSIDGIGPQPAARLIAELGHPAQFRDAGALAAYVGVIPATPQSGKSRVARADTHHGISLNLQLPGLTTYQRSRTLAWNLSQCPVFPDNREESLPFHRLAKETGETS